MRLVSFLSTVVISIFVLLFAVSKGFGVSEIVSYEPQVQAATITRFQPTGDEFVDQINDLRTNNSLIQLSTDEELNSIASIRAEDINNRSYYAHQNPDGLTYDAYFQDLPIYSCENLNLTSNTSFTQTIQDWLESPDHRDCLLDSRVNKIGYSTRPLDIDKTLHLYVLILSTDK